MRRRARDAVPGSDGPAAGRVTRRSSLKLPWQLEVGEPFVAPHSKLVALVRLPDGTKAVLKIHLDEDTESLSEPDALRFWNGCGAVRLLDQDPATRAMLIERCVPGTPLSTETTTRRSRSPRRRWNGCLGIDRERMRLWGLVKSLAWDNAGEAELFSQVGSRR